MKIGDLVKQRHFKEHKYPKPPMYGIIVGNRGLSWQREYRMWFVEWTDGTCGVLHEYNLEAICK